MRHLLWVECSDDRSTTVSVHPPTMLIVAPARVELTKITSGFTEITAQKNAAARMNASDALQKKTAAFK